MGNKHGENMVFKCRELYCIVFVYNYYKLTFFLVLIRKFFKSQIFIPDWPELGYTEPIVRKRVEYVVLMT